jgi:hypothetical protein
VAGVVTSGRQVVSELNGQISQLFACTRWIVGGGRTSALSTVEMRRAGKVKSLSSFHTFSTGAFTTALTLTWVDMVGGGVALGCCLLVGLEEEQGIVPRGLPKKGGTAAPRHSRLAATKLHHSPEGKGPLPRSTRTFWWAHTSYRPSLPPPHRHRRQHPDQDRCPCDCICMCVCVYVCMYKAGLSLRPLHGGGQGWGGG